MDFALLDTPLGTMGLGAEDGAIVRLYLPTQPMPRLMPCVTPLLKTAGDQLLELLAGTRRTTDLPLAPQGTPFQKKVWSALLRIPWGETRTYGEIAREVGCPGGARAVGMANHRNPIPILIPCHRVLGGGGRLTGYAGGLELKRKLLELEGAGFAEK